MSQFAKLALRAVGYYLVCKQLLYRCELHPRYDLHRLSSRSPSVFVCTEELPTLLVRILANSRLVCGGADEAPCPINVDCLSDWSTLDEVPDRCMECAFHRGNLLCHDWGQNGDNINYSREQRVGQALLCRISASIPSCQVGVCEPFCCGLCASVSVLIHSNGFRGECGC